MSISSPRHSEQDQQSTPRDTRPPVPTPECGGSDDDSKRRSVHPTRTSLAAPKLNVYTALAEHQIATDWGKRDLFEELHRWAAIFELEFKLQLPEIALCVDRLGRSRYGHFRPGRNGFGLSSEVAINEAHLDVRPFWGTLGTLLHELLHAWQQAHGRPGARNYHNKEFRTKAESLGLIVDAQGVTQYRTPSPFTQLLDRRGVHVPELQVSTDQRVLGSSKLKKWSCGCTNVRVAVPAFRALCLRCGREFQRVWP